MSQSAELSMYILLFFFIFSLHYTIVFIFDENTLQTNLVSFLFEFHTTAITDSGTDSDSINTQNLECNVTFNFTFKFL